MKIIIGIAIIIIIVAFWFVGELLRQLGGR